MQMRMSDQSEDNTKLDAQLEHHKEQESLIYVKLNSETAQRQEAERIQQTLKAEVERLKQQQELKAKGDEDRLLTLKMEQLSSQLSLEIAAKDSQKKEYQIKLTEMEKQIATEQKQKLNLQTQIPQLVTEVERLKRDEVRRKEEYNKNMDVIIKNQDQEQQRKRQDEEKKKKLEDERRQIEEVEKKKRAEEELQRQKKQKEERKPVQTTQSDQVSKSVQIPPLQTTPAKRDQVRPTAEAVVSQTKPESKPNNISNEIGTASTRPKSIAPTLPTLPKPALVPPNASQINRPAPVSNQRPRTKAPKISKDKNKNTDALPTTEIKPAPSTFQLKLNKTGIDLTKK